MRNVRITLKVLIEQIHANKRLLIHTKTRCMSPEPMATVPHMTLVNEMLLPHTGRMFSTTSLHHIEFRPIFKRQPT